jgi:hypothetical protein
MGTRSGILTSIEITPHGPIWPFDLFAIVAHSSFESHQESLNDSQCHWRTHN